MMAFWPHLLLLALVAVLFVWERFKPQAVAQLEESMLIGLMFLITAVSFGQVVARYGFNTGWSAALEFTTLAFSWLILLGMSYGIRAGTHLGVDILLKALPAPVMRYVAALGALAGLLYGLILLDGTWLKMLGIETRSGAIEYWAKMYKINIGTEELRWPVWVQETFDVKDRVQRWLVLLMLPVGLALLSFRSLQAMVQILTGQREMVIASHEAEELVEENKDALKELD